MVMVQKNKLNKFPLYSPHTLLNSLEKNCSIWVTFGLVMFDLYGHRNSKGQLHLRGNYLKGVRSKNMLWKKFEILNYKVKWFNCELLLILSIERKCKMSFLINSCTIRISDFMSFNWFFALYLLQKILFLYQYSNSL